ncbi:MAG: 50S ribosomal protein L23 [Candidatus Marsarchaeota archaeon]|jgi:large subunit ribosomal protein L23|nr:50S ribosomal protein L23 [Candidatus Marsarchaeota archaeon]MCL5111709.1 50S ribosomal protein L23 [Candidatus Marsarchaeota archaeon]
MPGTLRHPLSTEKAINQIGRSNVIAYIVDYRATKQQIKKEFEATFGVKVSGIRTMTTASNRKKAFVTIAHGYKAEDIAKRLKLV